MDRRSRAAVSLVFIWIYSETFLLTKKLIEALHSSSSAARYRHLSCLRRATPALSDAERVLLLCSLCSCELRWPTSFSAATPTLSDV